MKLWAFLTTDIHELNLKRAEEVTKAGTDAAKAVFDLAKTTKEQGSKVEISTLQSYFGQISSLLDVLNSPLAQIVKDTIPFAPLAVSILKLIAETTKKNPTLEQCIALVSQTAYLDSLKSLLEPQLQQLEQKEPKKASDQIAHQLMKLGDQEFSNQDAKDALLNFPNSELAQEFNKILKVRLQETGFSVGQAIVLCDRIAWNTNRFITQALASAANPGNPLVELYRNGGQEVLERYQSIEKYLREQIQPLPDEVIFREESTDPDAIRATYRELYVPLRGQPLDCDGKKLEGTELIPLDFWMMRTLNNPAKAKHMMFIQGEAGRGKSVFCRMVSDQIRRTLYPSYTPLLIRLRGLRTLANRLQDTLESAPELQNCDFVTSDSGWLTDTNTRFVFFLDGFDELLLEGRATGGLQEFLQQVEQFQQNSHHRFVITGRPLALLQVERLISQIRNIERIELQPMDDDLMQAWTKKWTTKVGQEESKNFWNFLKACPKDVQTLAREPLLMYLLARMHREKKLSVHLFTEEKGLPAKIRIYDAAIKWVLEKQRQNENLRLTGLESAELRHFLTEAATCVVHSGNEVAKISMLEARLKDSQSKFADFLKKTRQQPDTKDLADSKALNNLLASFYLKPASGEEGGGIEFVHKSFGEFLFAERLLEALEDWAEKGGRRQSEFLVSENEMHRELYDLLGYGGLTPDIVSYLIPRLVDHLSHEPLLTLFQRLNSFYDRWCVCEFIDSEPPTLPQETMRQLKAQGVRTGQHQVDVFAGLNSLILLLELNRYAQNRTDLKGYLVFYPSGRLLEESDDFTDRLLKVILYSDAIASFTFTNVVGIFLDRANLSGANLDRTTLDRANLSGADLSGANLSGANLGGTNLSGANLSGANLHGADLIGANLGGANLHRTTLNRTDLSGADLDHADLHRADLSSADLSGANLSGADLDRAGLYRANLSGANLSGANLDRANLDQANLEHVNLSGADLDHANLSGANLSNTNFYRAILLTTNLSGTNGLTQQQLEGQDPPMLCNVAFPEEIQINPNRDCDRLPEILQDRYPEVFKTINDAKAFMHKAQQKRWD